MEFQVLAIQLVKSALDGNVRHEMERLVVRLRLSVVKLKQRLSEIEHVFDLTDFFVHICTWQKSCEHYESLLNWTRSIPSFEGQSGYKTLEMKTRWVQVGFGHCSREPIEWPELHKHYSPAARRNMKVDMISNGTCFPHLFGKKDGVDSGVGHQSPLVFAILEDIEQEDQSVHRLQRFKFRLFQGPEFFDLNTLHT